jgi:hypothetical protein
VSLEQTPLIKQTFPLIDAWKDYRKAPAKEREATHEHVKQLQHRAVQAIANYRAAFHDSEREPIAINRYQARIRMATAWKVLETLVGRDEATRALRNRERRPWMRT